MHNHEHGPFYAILGGNWPDVLTSRPPGIAQKHFKSLLPIVVTCARREHAEAICQLNDLIKNIPHHDAHALAYTVQNSDLNIESESQLKIYAIMFGDGDTGIFCGINWHLLKHTIDPRSSSWCKPLSMKHAIIFMLTKPGHNFPLIGDGDPIPPPPRATRAQAQPLPGSDGGCTGNPTRTSHGTERASVPRGSRGREARHTEAVLVQAVRGSLNIGPSQEDDSDGLTIPLEIQVLRQVIRPLLLPGMPLSPSTISTLPITLGEHADDILTMKNVSNEDMLTILRARVHSPDYPTFSTHMGLALGWQPLESRILWEAIKLPCV